MGYYGVLIIPNKKITQLLLVEYARCPATGRGRLFDPPHKIG
jgi:hypothetical protein